MALYLLQPNIQPVGVYDVLDADVGIIRGGEIGVLDVVISSRLNDRAADDAFNTFIADGIDSGDTTRKRIVVRVADEATETRKLFYLIDEGIDDYGTLFGKTDNNVMNSTAGTSIGPSTLSGSHKVTLWDHPGRYGISLNNVHSDTGPNQQLEPDGDTPLPGELLYRHTDGKITRIASTGDKIGAFVELTNNNTLVSSSDRIVSAVEPTADRLIMHYFGPSANL